MIDYDVKYPEVPDGDEPESMYWDDTEDSEGYKEDGCNWIFDDSGEAL